MRKSGMNESVMQRTRARFLASHPSRAWMGTRVDGDREMGQTSSFPPCRKGKSAARMGACASFPFATSLPGLKVETWGTRRKSELEAVAHLGGDHSGVVEVKAAYRDAVVLQNAVIGYVH